MVRALRVRGERRKPRIEGGTGDAPLKERGCPAQRGNGGSPRRGGGFRGKGGEDGSTGHRSAGLRVEDQPARTRVPEVEHAPQAARPLVERRVADPADAPVVLDE